MKRKKNYSPIEGKCLECPLRQYEIGLDELETEVDGLWMLYKIAYTLYRFEVVGSGKLYNRYISDFLNSHTYTDRVDAAGMNEHRKNFHILEEFLTIRKDLVQKYFTKESLCDSDYLIMHQEFNTTQQPPKYFDAPVVSNLPPTIFTSKPPNFQCYFNCIQMSLITHSANEVRLFSSDVSEVEMEALFACRLKHPLKSACNRRVAFFFDALCEHKLISARWQHVIDKNGLILSSAKNTPLNSSKLSTALNEAKQNGGCVYRTIELYVQKITASGGV